MMPPTSVLVASCGQCDGIVAAHALLAACERVGKEIAEWLRRRLVVKTVPGPVSIGKGCACSGMPLLEGQE